MNIGQRFTDLIVISLSSAKGRDYVTCKCACGNTVEVNKYHLISGNSKSCRCQISKIKSKGEGYASYKFLFDLYKRNAKKSGRDFSLQFDIFKKLISSNCFYCDAEPKPFNKYLTNSGKQKSSKLYKSSTVELAQIEANGIDRVSNNIGYIESNCVPCCETCNFMKGTRELNEFLAQIEKIFKNHNDS